MTWKASIQKDNPWDLGVRLHVYRHHADGRLDVLLSDGLLQTLPEATAAPPNAGLMIPEQALEAIAEVFHPYATKAAQLEGVVRTLTQALNVADGRVDRIIDKALER